MILRAQKRGLPFEAVLCDALYGRSRQFRDKLDEAGLLYMAAIPSNSRVYLQKPEIGQPKPGKQSPKTPRKQVVNGVRSQSVEQVGTSQIGNVCAFVPPNGVCLKIALRRGGSGSGTKPSQRSLHIKNG